MSRPAGVDIVRDIEYRRIDHSTLHLDLYRPVGAIGALPAVVWIHGGGWFRGKKDDCPVAGFAKHGYVVVAVDYRVTREGAFPAPVYDCKTAVSWIRGHAAELGIDPERIGAWGSSAGGHLAAVLGTTNGDPRYEDAALGTRPSSDVRCVCAFFPATDLIALASSTDPRYSRIRTAIPWLLGGPVREHLELARAASPAALASAHAAPFLLFHGTADEMIPLEQSQALDEALRHAGVESRLVVLKGAGHEDTIYARPEVEAAVVAFFDRHLCPERVGTAPALEDDSVVP